MERKKIKIGLFGFGCVGKGLWDVSNQTPGLKTEIIKICVKDKQKQRPIPKEYFTFDKDELLYNPNINVIVELIDDADAAFEIVSTALKQGKAVVSANKKMIAEHFTELLDLQHKYDVPLLYEGASCASIPVIRNLEEYYDNDLLSSIEGIVNGSTNYILTKIFKDKLNYAQALKQAQDLGFAESNPKLDVEGFDARSKLAILLAHGFGTVVNPEEITNLGIQHIGELETRYAREKGLTIKLIARAKKLNDKSIAAFVLPQFIKSDNQLHYIDNEYNGVQIESCFADKQFFIGKGAGAFPTASAVLSDISALTYDYKYEYKKIAQSGGFPLSNNFVTEVFVRFTSDIEIDKSAFIEITEQYTALRQNYIIGRINFENLISADWFNQTGVSVILTENALVQQISNSESNHVSKEKHQQKNALANHLFV